MPELIIKPSSAEDFIESRALRTQYLDRTEVLDKVKALVLCPDGIHATMQDVATYFEVSYNTVQLLTRRHENELILNGFRKNVAGEEFHVIMTGNSEHKRRGRPNNKFFVRRTILNVAMLLTESAVAEAVRTHLLNVEEAVYREVVLHQQPVPQEGMEAVLGEFQRMLLVSRQDTERAREQFERAMQQNQESLVLLRETVTALSTVVAALVPTAQPKPVTSREDSAEEPPEPFGRFAPKRVWKDYFSKDTPMSMFFAVLQHVKVLEKHDVVCGATCYDAPLKYIRKGYMVSDSINPRNHRPNCTHTWAYFTEAGRGWVKENFPDWKSTWESSETVPAIEGNYSIDYGILAREHQRKMNEMGL